MTWLARNSDAINAFAAIAGLFVGIFGFGATIYQLRDTAATLRASNTYEIQRDARDLNDDIQTKGSVPSLLAGNLAPADRGKAEADVWRMFNFYLSVYRQIAVGGVSESFGESFKADFCQFVQLKPVADLWQQFLSSDRIGKAYVEMREEWCGR